MKVGQLVAVLTELAVQKDGSGRSDIAKDLRNLCTVFDGRQNHEVAKVLKEIRAARGL
jgi:hypothetical protein